MLQKGTQGSVQGDQLGGRAVHQSFLVVLQSRLTSDSGAKQFTCFCTCFQANRRGRGRTGGEGGGVCAGGRWKLFVGTCFLHVNLKELFLGSLWSEQNGTKYFSLEWRKVFCDEICEFKNGILLNSKKTLKKECEKHEHVSCLLFIHVFGRETEKV